MVHSYYTHGADKCSAEGIGTAVLQNPNFDVREVVNNIDADDDRQLAIGNYFPD